MDMMNYVTSPKERHGEMPGAELTAAGMQAFTLFVSHIKKLRCTTHSICPTAT